MRANEFLSEAKKAIKQRLDPKCWKGKHKEGTKIKGGVRVNNCVPNESVAEGSLEEYGDTAKGQKMLTKVQKRAVDRVVSKKADTDPAYAKKNSDTANRAWDRMSDKDLDEEWSDKYKSSINCSNPKGFSQKAHCAGKKKNEGLTHDQAFDIIEEMVESLALAHGVDPEVIWEDFESVDDLELLEESAAWRRSAGKSKSGGLNAKGVASYRRENPGSKLQTAVTTKPSKLKKGSKAAKRRKSFCARMGGVKGPMKKPNGKPTRKALALRKWNC